MDLHASSPGGDEGWGIWDTNRPSLQAVLEGMGYEVVDIGIVRDEYALSVCFYLPLSTLLYRIQAHVAAIQRGLDEADILLTTGGTSMGPTDLLKPVIERHFSGTVHFGRVAVKPGKPTTFATIPWKDLLKPIFALPGNPASALVTFQIFVVPALRKMGGWKKEMWNLPKVNVTVCRLIAFVLGMRCFMMDVRSRIRCSWIHVQSFIVLSSNRARTGWRHLVLADRDPVELRV
jgi:gephyrin